MTAKIGESRKKAFLNALGETGNVSVSAERARVSRSWALLHRKRDAGFDAACRAALGEARARLSGGFSTALEANGEEEVSESLSTLGRRSGEPWLKADGEGEAKESLGWAPDRVRGTGRSSRPPSGWGHLDGVELVVRGTNGRRVQIARARLKQWSPRVEQRFLAALASTCNVKAACAEVGMSQQSAYAHRLRWTAFADRWDEALECGYVRLEAGLIEAACNLFSEPGAAAYDGPIRPISATEAIQLLHLHQKQVLGIGNRPGLAPRYPPIEEVAPNIIRKIRAMIAAKDRSEAEKAQDEREWALRRSSGQALRRG